MKMGQNPLFLLNIKNYKCGGFNEKKWLEIKYSFETFSPHFASNVHKTKQRRKILCSQKQACIFLRIQQKTMFSDCQETRRIV